MSTRTVQVTTCDMCEKDIPNTDKAIKSANSDLDLHGIWMGDLGEYVWMEHEETFCSFKCFVDWLSKRRDEIERSKE